MDFALFGSFVLFTCMGALTPGPNNILLMSQGLRFGFKACWPYIFGVAAGFGTLLIAAALGLGLVVERFPLLMTLITAIGAAWLIWLAFGFFKASRAHDAAPFADQETSGRGAGRTTPIGFIESTLFQWVNPKGLIFAFGATAGFMGLSQDFWTRTLMIVGTFIVAGLIGNVAWAAAGGLLNQSLSGRRARRWVNRILAGVMLLTAFFILHAGLKSV